MGNDPRATMGPSLLLTGLLLTACSSDREVLQSRSFRTDRCRAQQLVEARPRPPGEYAYSRWTPPATRPIHLVELAGEVRGELEGSAGVLVQWRDLAAWTRDVDDGEVRWQSPLLDPPLDDGAVLELELRPGTARTVRVVSSHKAEVDRRVRGLRTTSFALDRAEDPGAPMVLAVDLDAVVGQNWGDERGSAKALHRIEVAVPADEARGFVLDRVAVLDQSARYTAAPAGVRLAEVRGRLHPSWYVHGGSQVRLPVDVPPGEPELRWYGSFVSEQTGVELTVRDGDQSTHLATTRGRAYWEHHTASLQPWAGRPVELVIEAQGPGVALLGDPRVVAGPPTPTTPDVLVYLVDTLRADHLGAWGSELPEISPNLDELARTGTTFAATISSSPWTKPAIPTVLTGLWATTHQVGARAYTDRLPVSTTTVQDRFREGGWRTASLASNPLGSTLSGLEHGFDTALAPNHWRGRMGKLGHPSAAQLHEALLSWWAEEPDQPIFAYVHTLEPHAWRRRPYADPPEGWESYDASIHDADTRFGELMAELRERELDDDLLIVFLSDHGESFGDHGVKGHGSGLWQSQVHIPLIFWAGEALPAATITHLAGLADVTPTLLDLVGLPPIPDSDGRSLVPLIDGVDEPVHQSVPSARVRYVWKPDDPKMYSVVRHDGVKALRIEGEARQVFDLSEDLCEGRTSPTPSDDLFEHLDDWLAEERVEAGQFTTTHGAATTGEVSAGDVELLRALGYVQ